MSYLNNEFIVTNIYLRIRVLNIQQEPKVDSMTWKLLILNCLKQLRGIMGQAIEFDLLEREDGEMEKSEIIVRIDLLDRKEFEECIIGGIVEVDSGDVEVNGIQGKVGGCLQILSGSISLTGVSVDRFSWYQLE